MHLEGVEDALAHEIRERVAAGAANDLRDQFESVIAIRHGLPRWPRWRAPITCVEEQVDRLVLGVWQRRQIDSFLQTLTLVCHDIRVGVTRGVGQQVVHQNVLRAGAGKLGDVAHHR